MFLPGLVLFRVIHSVIGVPAIFCQGGGGKPFAQKMFASCLNFYKTVEQKRAPMQQHRPHWHMKMAHTVFQGQYLPKLSMNYVAINKHLEKLPPQLHWIKMKYCCDQGCNDIGVVIATN